MQVYLYSTIHTHSNSKCFTKLHLFLSVEHSPRRVSVCESAQHPRRAPQRSRHTNNHTPETQDGTTRSHEHTNPTHMPGSRSALWHSSHSKHTPLINGIRSKTDKRLMERTSPLLCPVTCFCFLQPTLSPPAPSQTEEKKKNLKIQIRMKYSSYSLGASSVNVCLYPDVSLLLWSTVRRLCYPGVRLAVSPIEGSCRACVSLRGGKKLSLRLALL